VDELDRIAAEIRAHKDEVCEFEPCQTCTQLVPGEGAHDAEILFIGEAPGKNEDLQGRPFVGQAGKLLDELIGSIGLAREDVFITNILKARPPGNRDPLPLEVQHHWPWLDRQVEAIDPLLIVPLGRHAMNRFLPARKIGRDHGQARLMGGRVYYPVHHPAAALYTGSLKQTLLDDFAKIPALLERVRTTPREELEQRSAIAEAKAQAEADGGGAESEQPGELAAVGSPGEPSADQLGLF
jgi:DNA polymerase